ncbi:MAG TPA: hypothetical protein PLK99_09445 [Burkholderiales bacterium]|nr:hypothetical protein [Burkholderiales bacterium]
MKAAHISYSGTVPDYAKACARPLSPRTTTASGNLPPSHGMTRMHPECPFRGDLCMELGEWTSRLT